MHKTVTLFMPSFEGGGVQRVMLNLANGLNTRGYNVSFAVADGRGTMRNEADNKRYTIYDFKKYYARGDYKVLLSIFNLIKILKLHNTDFLITAPGFSSAIAIISAKIVLSKTRVILVIDDKISTQLQLGRKNRVAYIIYKLLYRYADEIVAAHKGAADDVIERFCINPKKIHVIYHPLINLEKINKTQKNIIIEKFMKPDDTIIVSVGRLDDNKNVSAIINAFDIIHHENKRTKLIIVGDGPEKELLSKLIIKKNLSKDIILFGYSNEPYEIMKFANIFVLASKKEAFGNVIIEALACGLTVVSSDTISGAQREILMNGKCGYLFKPNDLNDLAHKLRLAINNPIPKSNSIKRGKDFSIAKSSEKYIRVMERYNEKQ